MSLGKGFLFVGASFLALLTGLVVAGETPSSSKEKDAAKAKAAADSKLPAAADTKAPAAAGESVEQLIGQLDATDYDSREAACGKLAAKGKAAIAALEKAAAHGNLEVASRAATVLGKLLKSSDAATAKAATDALQRLADGDSPAAARKAKAILDKNNGLKNNGQGMNGQGGIIVPGNGFGGRIIINGGQLNIGGGATMRTMSVKNVNGVKEITATEDGKTVKIEDDPAKGIKIEVTEKQNGKEVTKKYEAKNAEDLKKNQPAGYELFKKYGGEQQQGMGAVQLQIQVGGGGNLPIPNAIPGMPNVPPQPGLPLQPGQLKPGQLRPGQLQPGQLQPGQLKPGQAIPLPGALGATAPLGNHQKQVEVATVVVKHLATQLEKLQKAEACKDASPESKAELKKQIDELSKRLQDVRGQLDK